MQVDLVRDFLCCLEHSFAAFLERDLFDQINLNDQTFLGSFKNMARTQIHIWDTYATISQRRDALTSHRKNAHLAQARSGLAT